MAEEATEKQISFAKSLGIPDPQGFTKTALKELINKKLSEKNGTPQKAAVEAPKQVSNAEPNVTHVIERKIAANSYEFGRAGNRFKVHYDNVSELKAHLKELTDNGFIVDTATFTPDEE